LQRKVTFEQAKQNPPGSAKKRHISNKQNKIRQGLQRKVTFRTNKTKSVRDCKEKSHSEHTKPNPTGSAKKSHIPEKQNKIRQVLQRKVTFRTNKTISVKPK
jgi:uncharacterized FlaG/YvyC family protein